jgi:hypothetical protein
MRTLPGSSHLPGSSIAAVVSIAVTVLICGCYFPDPKSVKEAEGVRQIQIGFDTRETVRELLGPPQVVESSRLYVYAWEESAGYVVVAAYYSGFGGPIGLRGSRACIEFDPEGDPGTQPRRHDEVPKS